MRKKALYLGGAVIAGAIIIATASSVFHRPIPKPAEITASRIRLNSVLTNADSELKELTGLDRRITNYMNKWQFKGVSLAITRND